MQVQQQQQSGDPYTYAYNQDWAPDVDVFDVENGMRIKIDLPGVKKEDLQVEFNEGNLIVTGTRKPLEKEEAGLAYVTERNYGK